MEALVRSLVEAQSSHERHRLRGLRNARKQIFVILMSCGWCIYYTDLGNVRTALKITKYVLLYACQPTSWYLIGISEVRIKYIRRVAKKLPPFFVHLSYRDA